MEELEWFEIKHPDKPGLYPITVNGKKLCLILGNEQLHVTSKRCPHAGADLSQGWCEGNKLVCPFHRHKFDLYSGKGDPGQGNYIRTYPTKSTDGKYFVGFKKSKLKNWFSNFGRR